MTRVMKWSRWAHPRRVHIVFVFLLLLLSGTWKCRFVHVFILDCTSRQRLITPQSSLQMGHIHMDCRVFYGTDFHVRFKEHRSALLWVWRTQRVWNRSCNLCRTYSKLIKLIREYSQFFPRRLCAWMSQHSQQFFIYFFKI